MATPRFTGPPGAPKQPKFKGLRSETSKKSGPQPPIPKTAPKPPSAKTYAKKGKPGMAR